MRLKRPQNFRGVPYRKKLSNITLVFVSALLRIEDVKKRRKTHKILGIYIDNYFDCVKKNVYTIYNCFKMFKKFGKNKTNFPMKYILYSNLSYNIM